MKEKLKFIKPIRNITAATAISLLPSSAAYAEINADETFEKNRVTLQDSPIEEQSILEQLDELVEEDYGKVLAYTLLGFSFLNAAYRLQKGLELDTDRQYGFNIISSASLIALTSLLSAQTEIDMDPRMTSALLTTFAVSNSAYSVDTMWQMDRSWLKRAPSLGAATTFLTTSFVIFANTIDKT